VTTFPIFLLGLLVTGITIAAVLSIGIDEAADESQSRDEDLYAFERALVDRPGTTTAETDKV
jgi:hypothetical protein